MMLSGHLVTVQHRPPHDQISSQRRKRIVMMHTTAVTAFALAALASGFVSDAARAQTWPERTVRIIPSFPAGTGGDISARLYAERLMERWGKPVIVENKPGADGILAVTAVIGARD